MSEGRILPRQRLRRCDIYITSIYIGITDSALTGRKSKTTARVDASWLSCQCSYQACVLYGVTQSL